jgi:hypothetical protein
MAAWALFKGDSARDLFQGDGGTGPGQGDGGTGLGQGDGGARPSARETVARGLYFYVYSFQNTNYN